MLLKTCTKIEKNKQTIFGTKQREYSSSSIAPEVSQYCASIPEHDDGIDRYILLGNTAFHQYKIFVFRGVHVIVSLIQDFNN